MKRRHFLYGLGGTGVVAAGALPRLSFAASLATRTLLIAVDESSSLMRQAAQTMAEATGHTLLEVLTGPGKPKVVSSHSLLAGSLADRALNHLILIGLPSDPIIAAAWQREARQTSSGFYVFGFGTFKGDIGYIESDRNPFLHSAAIESAPFETETITITGTTPQGVQQAVDAFLTQHLTNGLVAAPGWTRTAPGLLDRDPLGPGFTVPELAPESLERYRRIGLTQPSEDEYRGVLADAGVAPISIWRAKYYTGGVWDNAGALAAFDAYSFGLHRRAYGNSRWVATFASTRESEQSAPRIASAAGLTASGSRWTGLQPYYELTAAPGNQIRGPLTLWQDDSHVIMSTIPVDANK